MEIFHIDDSQEDALLVGRILKPKGIKVFHYFDIESAPTEKESVVILLDLRLILTSGEETLKAVLNKYKKAAIVVLTTSSIEDVLFCRKYDITVFNKDDIVGKGSADKLIESMLQAAVKVSQQKLLDEIHNLNKACEDGIE